MKKLSVLCVILYTAAMVLNYLCAEPPRRVEEVALSLRLLDRSRSDSKVRVLAEPNVATPIGSPFAFVSGGSVKSKSGGPDLEFGIRASGKVTQRADGRMHLALTLGVGGQKSPPDDADTDLVRTETLEIQCLLQPGILKRIDCGGSQTCELRVERVE